MRYILALAISAIMCSYAIAQSNIANRVQIVGSSTVGNITVHHGAGIVMRLSDGKEYYIRGTLGSGVPGQECSQDSRLTWRLIDDLDHFESLTIPPSPYPGIADLEYSQQTRKLYVLMRGSSVWEVDPFTGEKRELSRDPLQGPETGFLGNLVVDGDYYYVLTQTRPTALFKHRLSDGELIAENRNIHPDCGHSLALNPATGQLYGHSGDMTEPPTLWEFDKKTLAVIRQASFPTLGATHEMAIVPAANRSWDFPTSDYAFICVEGSLDRDQIYPLIRVNLDDFSYDLFWPTWTGGTWGASYIDGSVYVAYGGYPSRVMKLNPYDLTDFKVWEFPADYYGLNGAPVRWSDSWYGTHYRGDQPSIVTRYKLQ